MGQHQGTVELLLAGIILGDLMPKDTKAKISEAMNAKRI
jgi:hypothetical protein